MKRFFKCMLFFALALPVLLVNSCAKKVVEPELLAIRITPIPDCPSDGGQMCFADLQNGIMRGQDGIWKTTDGGINWHLSIDPHPYGDLISIHYPNKDTAYFIVEANSSPYLRTVYQSTNATATWSAQMNLGRNFVCSFYDGKHGYGFGELPPSTIFKFLSTSDAGASWTVHPGNLSFNSLHYVQFANSYIGIGNDGGSQYNTFDGGLTWNNIGPADYHYNPEIFTGGVVFRMDYDRNMYRSGDYGNTWTKFLDNPDSWIPDFDCLPSGFCCASMGGRLIVSRDFGVTWKSTINIAPIDDLGEIIIGFVHILDEHTIIATARRNNSPYVFLMARITVE